MLSRDGWKQSSRRCLVSDTESDMFRVLGSISSSTFATCFEQLATSIHLDGYNLSHRERPSTITTGIFDCSRAGTDLLQHGRRRPLIFHPGHPLRILLAFSQSTLVLRRGCHFAGVDVWDAEGVADSPRHGRRCRKLRLCFDGTGCGSGCVRCSEQGGSRNSECLTGGSNGR